MSTHARSWPPVGATNLNLEKGRKFMNPSRTESPSTRPDPAVRRLVSLQRGAEYLECAERTIRRMVADGRITGYRVGPRMVRIDLNELDALLTRIMPQHTNT